MGFIKTGDAVPFNIFDHNGKPLSEEDIKKVDTTELPKDDSDIDNNTDEEVDDEQKQSQ